MVYRVYVKKRNEYAVEANEILNDLRTQLKIENLENLEVVNRYDISGISKDALDKGINTILSEPMVDDVYYEEYQSNGSFKFAIEYLPGQYDQRADASEQCFQLLSAQKGVKVKCAKLIVLFGNINEDDVKRIQAYLINPVDQRLASLEKSESLDDDQIIINKVPIIEGFINFSDEELNSFIKNNGMAMNFDDLKVTQDYFRDEEKRDPTETELRVLDTYWSDHCRHTTFSTIITDISVNDGKFKEIIEEEINNYKASRHMVYGLETKRPITLMDLATISMKELRTSVNFFTHFHII